MRETTGTTGTIGEPLDATTRRLLERVFRCDLEQVRIHRGRAAAESAAAVNARAYTVGRHIVFGREQYAPDTTRGLRLLVHEICHVLQFARARRVRAGLAPASCAAERAADRLARFAVPARGRLQTVRPGAGFPGGTAVWSLHRQTIQARGPVLLNAQVGGAVPGSRLVGTVQARAGDVARHGGVVVNNGFALEYRGQRLDQTRWLQFLWCELPFRGTDPATGQPTTLRATGQIRLNGLPYRLSDALAPNWVLDKGAAATSAFYDDESPFAGESGFAIRTSAMLAMFDEPGGDSARHLGAAVFAQSRLANLTSVAFVAHLTTFLVQAGQAVFHVRWTSTTGFSTGAGGVAAQRNVYAIESAVNVPGLPRQFRDLVRQRFTRADVR